MLYPTLSEPPTTRQNTDVFLGYNHNLRIADGEFYDMQNLTSDEYPVLSPRRRRGTYAYPLDGQGLISKEKLCYVDNTAFVVGDQYVEMGLSTKVEDCPKRLTSMGAYVIILPDKKYINTADLDDFGDIEATATISGDATFTLARVSGEDYEVTYTQAEAPEGAANVFWIDTSSEPHSLKTWSATTKAWVTIATTYIKIAASNIGKRFSLYDGVDISGLKGVANKDIAAIDGSFIIWGKSDDYILVVGLIDKTETLAVEMTVSRKMPELDFVTESENRLWGCRYGVSETGEMINEIYASKLGDFKNWRCYMGLSTDSYTVSVGTDGAFTGACTHLGHPLFFKENCMHKLYGSYPANFQLQTTTLRGVQSGCDRSLAIVNETLFYKSRDAICAYDGSLPIEISSALGDEVYDSAAACGHGNKYYISMRGKDGYNLFVYDTKRGFWHREDDLRVRAFASHLGELYYIDDVSGDLKTIGGSGKQDENPVKWKAETGIIGTDMPDKKYISRVNVRMSLDVGARMYIFAEYDSSGGWQHVTTVTGHSLRSFSIPIRPKRCDHMRLRFEGEGEAKIYSITRSIEQGSDY